MTTSSAPRDGVIATGPSPRPLDAMEVREHPRSAVGRTLALARSELRALGRNKVSVFYAVAFAPLMLLLVVQLPFFDDLSSVVSGDMATLVIAMLTVFGITMAVYFNLTTAAVARRESLTIKRHLASQPRTAELLTAIAVPNLLILLAQVVGVAAVAMLVIGVPALTNPVLALLGVLLGGIVFALLAYLTSATTRTVESAQLTTMPIMLVGLAVSGLIVPLSVMPDVVESILVRSPVYPVVDLVTIGLAGTTRGGQAVTFGESFGAAAPSLVVLVLWIGALAWGVSRYMRYEPRR